MTHPKNASIISTCPHCKEEFIYTRGRGRTPIYCSDNCRKYAAAHRKYAQETGTPVRIIKDTEHTEPHPEPKTVTVYQRPRKKDLRAFLRENPQELLPDVLRELGYCFTSTKISREERERLAQAFGFALLHLHTAETFEPTNEKKTPFRSGLSAADYVVVAEQMGAYEELCAQVEEVRERVERRERYLDAYIDRRARKIAERQKDERATELRRRIRKLEWEARQAEATYIFHRQTMERKYEDAVTQRLELARVSSQKIAELEAAVEQWQKHAEQWEQVAKMTQARAEEAAVRGRQVFEDGAGSAFFKEA